MMQGRSTGVVRKQTTAHFHRCGVKRFLYNLTKEEVMGLMMIGERGGLIDRLIETKALSAATVQAYTQALVGFLDFLSGSPRWIRKLRLTKYKLKEVSERVRRVAESLRHDVNLEKVERYARGNQDLPLEEWMLGAYLQSRRPYRCNELLEKAENDSMSISPYEMTEARDILIVLLIISNAKRPGDLAHIPYQKIADLKVPENGDLTEIFITKHKEAKSGKICPLTLDREMVIMLKLFGDYLRPRQATTEYLFTTITGDILEPSSMSKSIKKEWKRFEAELGSPLPCLTASLNRKRAVTSVREAGASRVDQETLARHMAHSVVTADKYYDRSRQQERRHDVLNMLQNRYKQAPHM